MDSDEPIWTEERIQKLISDRIEEGAQLDYKAAGAIGLSESKKTEITKDISAFANSSGGMVIYGVTEFSEEGKRHLPERIDPIDAREFSREWLDQIVGQINPRIDGIQIFPVQIGSVEWQRCYVVQIPKSFTAHQARDLRYYRRYNFESVAMADHEIRDVMNRRIHPKLEFKIKPFRTGHATTKVAVRIWNKGTVVPNRYGVLVLLPTVVGGYSNRPQLQRCSGGSSFSLARRDDN